jgi:hypothetical protein
MEGATFQSHVCGTRFRSMVWYFARYVMFLDQSPPFYLGSLTGRAHFLVFGTWSSALRHGEVLYRVRTIEYLKPLYPQSLSYPTEKCDGPWVFCGYNGFKYSMVRTRYKTSPCLSAEDQVPKSTTPWTGIEFHTRGTGR